MKKSKYIDTVVLLACFSHKKPKPMPSIDALLAKALATGDTMIFRQKDKTNKSLLPHTA
jgi:hypothetical protein